MKQFSLILNLVLLAAVGYLYYHTFSGNTAKATVKKDDVKAVSDNAPSGKVAYINMDTLENNYSYFKALKAEFESKQENGNSSLEAQQKRFQARTQQLQQKAQTMTQAEQEAAGREIQEMQQSLQKAKMDLDNELYKSSTTLKENIYKKLENFLKEYNKDRKYDYILSFEPTFMLYRDSALNITKMVVDGLNEAEKKNKQ
jgi:outer membrane protein